MHKKSMDELDRKDVDAFREQKKNSIIVILDDIRSMHNVGSVFRTCDAFNIAKIILCGVTPCPPHRDIHKSALGATESVKWEYEKDILRVIEKLKSNHYKIIAIEQVHHSMALNNFTWNPDEKAAFIFGNEVHGINDEVLNHCHMALEIPQFGTKHSLNISVSVGVVLWEMIR